MFGPTGLYRNLGTLSFDLAKTQTGLPHHYLSGIVFGALYLIIVSLLGLPLDLFLIAFIATTISKP